VVVSNGDGTFNIYINTLFCPEKQRESLKHEIDHLTEEHFFRDDLSISQIERSACGIFRNRTTPKRHIPDVLFYHPAGKIALFPSLESLGAYAKAYAKQYKEDLSAGGR